MDWGPCLTPSTWADQSNWVQNCTSKPSMSSIVYNHYTMFRLCEMRTSLKKCRRSVKWKDSAGSSRCGYTTDDDLYYGQYYCSCLPVSILLPVKKLLFWKKMLCSGNLILCRLAKCCDASMFALAAKYHIEPHDVVRSIVLHVSRTVFGFIFLN